MGNKMETTQEQYVEHEVKLRVQKETSDIRFLSFELKFDKLEKKIDGMEARLESKIDKNFHIILGIFITAVLLPIVLHALRLT